ncbi:MULTISPECIES: hypothetical protein [Carboxydothermus]|uniref:Conserved domain protein n=2 Tax=Carboxydothermus TaxID=129957 RepID=Q3ACA2_CARHZ|nr:MULTISPECIES: hypothetical protein [Carboxydothermus]ABB15653.1 conserved domain protein [Carboxydothermus hydrogenoformans Z-2901]NYE58169.1 ferritin-like metal-binding protein YciE [Carboxydothermus ferrireducens DSM 11255]
MELKDLLLMALKAERQNYLFLAEMTVKIKHPELRSLFSELQAETLRQIFLLETLVEEKLSSPPVVKKLISLFRK